jgi:hypothetical protein
LIGMDRPIDMGYLSAAQVAALSGDTSYPLPPEIPAKNNAARPESGKGPNGDKPQKSR